MIEGESTLTLQKYFVLIIDILSLKSNRIGTNDFKNDFLQSLGHRKAPSVSGEKSCPTPN